MGSQTQKEKEHKYAPVRRILNLNLLLQQSQWTSKSPKVKDQNLTIYIDNEYKQYLQTNMKTKNYIGNINWCELQLLLILVEERGSVEAKGGAKGEDKGWTCRCFIDHFFMNTS